MSRQDSSSSGSSGYSNENPQNYNMQSYDTGNQMIEHPNDSVGNMSYNQGDLNMSYMNTRPDQTQQSQYMSMPYDQSNMTMSEDAQVMTPTCSAYSMNPTSNYIQSESSYTNYSNPTNSSCGGLPPASSLFSSSSLTMDYNMNRGSSSAPPIHSTSNVYLQNQPTYGNSSGNQPLPPLSSFAQPQGPAYGQSSQPLPRTPLSAPPQHPQQSPSMPPPSPFISNPGTFQESGLNPPARVDSVSSEPTQSQQTEFRPPSSSFSNPGSTMSAPPESPAVNRPPSVKTHAGNAYSQPQHGSGPSEYYMQPGSNMPIELQQSPANADNVIVQHSPTANIYVQHLAPRPPSQQPPTTQPDQQQETSTGQDQLKPPKNPPRYRNPGSYSPRGGSARSKTTSLSTMLPMLRAPTAGLSAGDDGPTVRQHLQQQQAAQRQRMQQELMAKRMKEDEMKQTMMVASSMPMQIHEQPQNIQMTTTYLPQTAYIQVISTEPPPPPPQTMITEPPKPVVQQSQPPPKRPPPKRQRPSRAKSTTAAGASAIITTTPTESVVEGQQATIPPPKPPSRAAKRNYSQGQQVETEQNLESAQSPSKQPRIETPGQTQCRIVHFQKPPPTESEFPQTETTIHVVQAPPPYSIQVQQQGQQQPQMQVYQAQVQPGMIQQQPQQQYFIVEQVQTPSGQQQTRQQMFIPASPTKQQQHAPQGYQVQQQMQQPYMQEQPGVVRVQQIREGVISVQQFPTVAQIQQNETYTQVQESGQVEIRATSDQEESQSFDRPPQQHFIIQASPTVVEASGRVLSNVGDGVTTTVYSTMPPPQAPGTTSSQRPQFVRTTNQNAVMVAAPANGAPVGAPPQTQVYRNGTAGSRPPSGQVRQRQMEEERKFDMKCYYLKRTIKSLCFKNAALCDEVARLHERIATVTEERKVLAKRLQHYERNRIRRLQTQQRKADAAAAARMGNAPCPSSSKKTSVFSSSQEKPTAPMTAPVISMGNFSYGKPEILKGRELTVLIQKPKQEDIDRLALSKVFSPTNSIGSEDRSSPITISMQPPESFSLSVITTPSPIGTMNTSMGSNATKITPSPRSTRDDSQASEMTSQEIKQALNLDSGESSPTQRELRERRGSANKTIPGNSGQTPQTKPSPGTRSSARQIELQQKLQKHPPSSQQLQPIQIQPHQRARSKSSVSPTVKPDKPLTISTTRASTEGMQSDSKISPADILSSPISALVSPRPRSGSRKQKQPLKKDPLLPPEAEENEVLSNCDEMTPEREGSEESGDTSKSNTPSMSTRKHSNSNTVTSATKARSLPTRAPSKRKAKKT